jgi:plastocyanin
VPARFRARALLALAATLALAALLAAAAPASGQGAVSGQVTLVERRGAEHDDLKNAVVWLEAPARSGAGADDPALRSGTIAMRGREFIPHVRPVLAGASVAFPNQDPFSHNVFSNAEPGSFDLGLYRRGASRSATFARPGVYPIYCNIHSKMVSFVVAVPTPYVAQPAKDGEFTIPGVPEGTYLLHAWHERAAAAVTHEITVPAAGLSGLRIALDAQSYVAAPHLNKFGLPYSATRSDRY